MGCIMVYRDSVRSLVGEMAFVKGFSTSLGASSAPLIFKQIL